MKSIKNIFLFFIFINCIPCFAQDTIVKNNGNKTIAKVLEIGNTQVKYKKFDFQDGPTYVEDKSGIRMIIFSNGAKEEFSPAPVVVTPSPTVVSIEHSKTAPEEANADYYGARSSSPSSSIKLKQRGNAFYLNGTRIREKVMFQTLRDTKDKQIIDLAGQSRDAQKLKYIGFGAIPLGIASVYFLSESYNVRTASYSKAKLNASGAFFVAAMLCPAASLYFNAKKKNCRKAAIKLYNERY